MQYILEIAASTIVGGLIFLMVLQLNGNIIESTTGITIEKTVHGNLVSLTEELDFDFKRIGYKVTSGTAILVAGRNEIRFKSDIDNNGSIDEVHYYLSDTNRLLNSENPNDKLLFRIVNNSPAVTSNLGVVDFKIWYFNEFGEQTAIKSEIKQIKYALEVQSLFKINTLVDTTYISAYAERRIIPKNLR